MPRKTIVTAIAAISLTLAGHASAQYSYSEDFTSTVPGPGEGDWNAAYVNAGTYSSGDTNPADWTEYNAAVTAPTTAPADPNGNYANFYARYADSGIRSTFFFKNLGGYSGSDAYSANNGEHTVTACYYAPEVADGGADLAGGVTAGIGLRFSGAGYASWPGDANTFQHSVAVPTNTTRGAWQRLSMTFTLTDAARVDLGFFVTNPALTAPYINTGILWDDLYIGSPAGAPTSACGDPAAVTPSNPLDPNAIPAVPLGGLLGLVALVGLVGRRYLKR